MGDVFRFDSPGLERLAREALRGMPPVQGAEIRVGRVAGLRDRYGAAHAGSFLRERRIAFDCHPGEFARIFVHEAFHFVWLRLGNGARRSYEELLRSEKARGELGWSAEWRKRKLGADDAALRSRRWREYCCESFCDSAAWLYSGVERHPEYTLAARFRERRRDWFARSVEGRTLSI